MKQSIRERIISTSESFEVWMKFPLDEEIFSSYYPSDVVKGTIENFEKPILTGNLTTFVSIKPAIAFSISTVKELKSILGYCQKNNIPINWKSKEWFIKDGQIYLPSYLKEADKVLLKLSRVLRDGETRISKHPLNRK